MPISDALIHLAYRKFYNDHDPAGPSTVEVWRRLIGCVIEAISQDNSGVRWQPLDLDLQDTAGITAIHLQPAGVGIEPCLIAETVGGRKPYMRVWPRNPELGVEWGLILSATSFPLWTMKDAS